MVVVNIEGVIMDKFYRTEYDGYFFVKDQKIYFWITDDKRPLVRLRDGTEKLTRYFHFCDENGQELGDVPVYDTFEQLQNITNEYAKEKYLNLLRGA